MDGGEEEEGRGGWVRGEAGGAGGRAGEGEGGVARAARGGDGEARSHTSRLMMRKPRPSIMYEIIMMGSELASGNLSGCLQHSMSKA